MWEGNGNEERKNAVENNNNKILCLHYVQRSTTNHYTNKLQIRAIALGETSRTRTEACDYKQQLINPCSLHSEQQLET